MSLFKGLLGTGHNTRTALLRAGTCHRTMRARVVTNVTGACCALLVLSHRVSVSRRATSVVGHGMRAVHTVGSTTVAGTTTISRDRATCTRMLTSLPTVHRDVHRARGTLYVLLERTPRAVGHDALRRRRLPSRFSMKVPLRLLSGHPSIGTTRVTLTGACCGAGSTHTTFCPRVAVDNSTN